MEDQIDRRWRKSSYSGNGGGDCAEVGDDTRRVIVRDTKDRTGPRIAFRPAAWRRFTEQLKRSLSPALPAICKGARSRLSRGCPPSLCQHRHMDQRPCLRLIRLRRPGRNNQFVRVPHRVLYP
jgi:hypothetical protein